MKSFKLIFSILLVAFCQMQVQAQDSTSFTPKNKKVYVSSGVEGSLLQIAFRNPSIKTIPRYTYFFNTGFDINYKMNKNLVVFSGIHMRNIGLITKWNDSTKIKERVYLVGAPLGFKIKSNDNDLQFKFGVDASLAMNYKWKRFVHNKKVFKDNEFFSDKASNLFTSVFAGMRIQRFSITANYYLNNFYNSSLIEANLLTIGVGFDLDEKKPSKARTKSKSLKITI